MELGELKAARKELEKALREEPESIKIISNLGMLAHKAGNRAEAEAFFRIVLDMDPNDPVAKHFL
jgi:Tfp pilus assembly protein PilF